MRYLDWGFDVLRRRVMVAMVTGVLGVGLAFPLASAGAKTVPVRQAVQEAAHAVQTSPAAKYVTAHEKQLKSRASQKAMLPRVKALTKLYRNLAAFVARSSATTAADRQLRTLWTQATDLESQVATAFVAELNDELAGNLSGELASLKRLEAYGKRAQADYDKADKLIAAGA